MLQFDHYSRTQLIQSSNEGTGSYNPDANTESNTNEPYLDLQNYLLGLPDSELPSVLTTSYGDDEQSVSYEYAVRVCRGYAALGLRSVSSPIVGSLVSSPSLGLYRSPSYDALIL